MNAELLPLPPAHPYMRAHELATIELAMGHEALRTGNDGKARVCGRRAVGIFIQTINSLLPTFYGPHAMANLRGIEADTLLPDEIRASATRLLGGVRSIDANQPYSLHPLADAAAIINYFVSSAA